MHVNKMSNKKNVLVVVAHTDDESFGVAFIKKTKCTKN
jgi:LmbE family N-acetylglucosaminyl deacetylase